MSKQEKIKAAVQEVETQLRGIEELIEKTLRENKPENAGLVAALLEDIKNRHTFQ